MMTVTFNGTWEEVNADILSFLKTMGKKEAPKESKVIQLTPAEPKAEKAKNTPTQTQAPTQTAQPTPTPAPTAPTAPTAQQAISLEAISREAVRLMDEGKEAQVRAIFTHFSVSSLSEIPESRLPEVATYLRSLGANL